ncbi:MAG: DUF4911 domain-containing protein [Myxococcales bacterium]|nr:DUF4911 domain-containing protein [Myxococcales bacterium]
MSQGKAVPPLIGDELCTRRIRVQAKDVVYLKGILEASEGLAHVFAERGGDLVVATHPSQIAELDRVLADLAPELGWEACS